MFPLSHLIPSLPPHLDTRAQEELLESPDEPAEAEKPLVTQSCLRRDGRACVCEPWPARAGGAAAAAGLTLQPA